MRYRDGRTILKDVILKCRDIISKDSDITARWDYATDRYVITNHDVGLEYILTSGHLLKLCEMPIGAEYHYEISKVAYFILDKELPDFTDHKENDVTLDTYELMSPQILNDVCQRCYELDSRIKPTMIKGYWNRLKDEYIIENYLFYRTYQISSDAMTDMTRQGYARYVNDIDSIARYLAYDSSKPEQPYEINSKENNKMFKKLSDTNYENTVAAITDEYEDKKRDAQAEYNEKLAKAEAEKVTANILEEADLWAYDLYARYNALHESGFAEELSIELLKLYISSKK